MPGLGANAAPPPLPSAGPHGPAFPSLPPAYTPGTNSAPPAPPSFDQSYNDNMGSKSAYPPGPSVSVASAPKPLG